jgi:hypothetical protein
MDRRAIALYLARKGLAAVEIHDDLVATLGPKSVNYPSVTHYLRRAQFTSSKPSIIFSEPEPEFDDSYEAILLILSESPFASMRQSARLAHLSRSPSTPPKQRHREIHCGTRTMSNRDNSQHSSNLVSRILPAAI